MNAFEIAEAEWLAANPDSRAAGYTPPTVAASAAKEMPVSDEITSADLAEAAAFALSPEGRRTDPHGAKAVWDERVRRAEADAAGAGPVAPAPGGQAASVAVEPNAADWKTVTDLAAARDPYGKRYADDLGISGQRVRALLDQARNDVFAGRPLDPAMLKFAKDAIAADQAAFDTERKAKEAQDLAEFRDKRGR